MPRRTLEQNVKAGVLTLGNVGTILSVSTQTAKKVVIRNQVEHWTLPTSNEVRVCPISLLHKVIELDLKHLPCLEVAAKAKQNMLPTKHIAAESRLTVTDLSALSTEGQKAGSFAPGAGEGDMELPLDEFTG